MINMLKKYTEILKKIRKGVIDINDFSYLERKDKDNYSYDANHLKRYQLLIALQYNRKKSDETILKKLMKSEIFMLIFYQALSVPFLKSY